MMLPAFTHTSEKNKIKNTKSYLNGLNEGMDFAGLWGVIDVLSQPISSGHGEGKQQHSP